MVCNAVVEMRRYYSRKVIDVLIKVIRTALDKIRRRFMIEPDSPPQKPIFILNAILMIPNVVIKPSLDDLQEILVTAGKNISGIAKGVAQWSSGRDNATKLAVSDYNCLQDFLMYLKFVLFFSKKSFLSFMSLPYAPIA